MTIRCDRLFMRTGFRSFLAIVLAMLGVDGPAGGALFAQAQPSANAPISASEAARRMKLPRDSR